MAKSRSESLLRGAKGRKTMPGPGKMPDLNFLALEGRELR